MQNKRKFILLRMNYILKIDSLFHETIEKNDKKNIIIRGFGFALFPDNIQFLYYFK